MSEPVLVLGFNRPDHLAVLLRRLAEVQPTRLFLALDGPRADHADDEARVQACRDLVAHVSWPCELQTLYQEENLGCGRGVSTAITWFFSQVQRGIILEDDIIPDASFFGFMSELLERYEHDRRVFAISGSNAVPRPKMSRPHDPYRFSRIALVWGWATWKRSWDQYQFDLTDWHKGYPIKDFLRGVDYSPIGALYWATEFELTARGTVDTWDWQWMAAAMRAGGLIAVPNVNLVENIGFDGTATHTTSGKSPLPPVQAIALPTHPVPVASDAMADRWTTRRYLGGTALTTLDRIRKFAGHRGSRLQV